jgi:hypothetical protein
MRSNRRNVNENPIASRKYPKSLHDDLADITSSLQLALGTVAQRLK